MAFASIKCRKPAFNRTKFEVFLNTELLVHLAICAQGSSKAKILSSRKESYKACQVSLQIDQKTLNYSGHQ